MHQHHLGWQRAAPTLPARWARAARTQMSRRRVARAASASSSTSAPRVALEDMDADECLLGREGDRIMVSYTTRHVYYTMPRCLGPSHPDTNARCTAMTIRPYKPRDSARSALPTAVHVRSRRSVGPCRAPPKGTACLSDICLSKIRDKIRRYLILSVYRVIR